MAIENLKPLGHYALENPASIFDEEAMTALQLAGRTASKLNEVIALLLQECKEQNLTIDSAVNYLKAHLDDTVHELLYEMAENGQLDILLRNNYERVRQNILPIANVKEFGAVGDGVHDDSEAIVQAMMDHDQIYFPEGTYRLTQPIDLYTCLHLYGAGVGKTILKYEGNKYLFNVKARFGNQPIIESMTFEGLDTNGLLNCDCGKWGATVAMRDFTAYQFNDVMRFASAFGCIIENGLIMTYGKIIFTTYDHSAQETNFNNCNVFRNVYLSAYSTTNNICHLELFNVRDLTFENCQLEKADLLMRATNKVRMVKFKDCWFEKIGTFYNIDDTCLAPVTQNCNFVEVAMRNGSATKLDFLAGAPTIKDVSGGKNVWNTMLGQNIELAGSAIESPTDGYTDWTWAYRIGTNGADFRMPVNTRVVRGQNVTALSQDLKTILHYSPVSCTFRSLVFCQYADFASRLFRVTVYRRSSSWFIHHEEISNTNWEGSAGNLANTTITCADGVLQVNSSHNLVNCEIMTEFNVHPV